MWAFEKKTEYVLGISESWKEYENLNWNELSDEQIIEKLTKLRGVGKWTAENDSNIYTTTSRYFSNRRYWND